jgi:RNA polymerase sigma-70 factor (ECF subfamily)
MIKHYDEISYYIQKLTGDKTLAKDLTQETYVKVLEINKNSDTTIQKAYLYKIAQNLVIDKVRRDKILIQTPYEDECNFTCLNDSPEDIISNELRKKKLKECIKNLSTQNKKAFILHYYKGYSRKEISEILEISVNAVEKNITRAVLKIKEQMKKDY